MPEHETNIYKADLSEAHRSYSEQLSSKGQFQQQIYDPELYTVECNCVNCHRYNTNVSIFYGNWRNNKQFCACYECKSVGEIRPEGHGHIIVMKNVQAR